MTALLMLVAWILGALVGYGRGQVVGYNRRELEQRLKDSERARTAAATRRSRREIPDADGGP